MLTKVDNYYLSDLSWWILRKYPSMRNSPKYQIIKDSFNDLVDSVNAGYWTQQEWLNLVENGIRNWVKEDLKQKKNPNKERAELFREEIAAHCLVLIDLVT